MPLTDPELDLLREMLDEDPADDSLYQVSEELVRRCRWADAEEVLTRGVAALQGAPERAGQVTRLWELLARAALETSHFDLAASALGHVSTHPTQNLENARVEVLVLERSGRTQEALEAARRFLGLVPHDVIVESAIERLEAPPPSPRIRAADPFYTVERAERYVLLGRRERAIRAYRRILLAIRPGGSGARPVELDPLVVAGLELRLRQLQADGGEGASDDLSEELTDPGLVPELPPLTEEGALLPVSERPVLEMPEPSLQRVVGLSAPPEPDSAPVTPDERTLEERTLEDVTTSDTGVRRPPGPSVDDPDDEDTDVDVLRTLTSGTEETTKRDRRKRRSLIRR